MKKRLNSVAKICVSLRLVFPLRFCAATINILRYRQLTTVHVSKVTAQTTDPARRNKPKNYKNIILTLILKEIYSLGILFRVHKKALRMEERLGLGSGT